MAAAAACHLAHCVSATFGSENSGKRREASVFKASSQTCAVLPSPCSRQGIGSRRSALQVRLALPSLQGHDFWLQSRKRTGERRSSLQVLAALQDLQQGPAKKEKKVTLSELGLWFAGTVALAVGGAAMGMYIDKFTDAPCMVTQTCKQIPEYMKTLLIGTHLYNFMLLPATMFILYDRFPSLVKDNVRSPFAMSLGVAYMMVSMAGEIGWHVTQEWYYHDEYMVLNLIFYVFLNLGLGLWAWGMKIEEPGKEESGLSKAVDNFLLATPFLTVLFYLLGAEFIHTKVPIFITTSGIFVALTYRFYKLLNTWAVLGFPFFSVGVNLFFISKLNEYGSDPFLNPLFHICHDALGTMLGMAYIAGLTYITPIGGNTEESIAKDR